MCMLTFQNWGAWIAVLRRDFFSSESEGFLYFKLIATSEGNSTSE